jgi:maltose alpha-D-glucosyltransferase/alpha-amylase
VLHEFVPNEGDAWEYTLDVLDRFHEDVVVHRVRPVDSVPEQWPGGLLDRALLPIPDEVDELVGSYLQSAQLLGERVAELHLALAGTGGHEPPSPPEPFTPHHRRSVYQSLRNITGRTLRLLRSSLGGLSEPDRDAAMRVLAAEDEILARFRVLVGRRLDSQRIRTHGDLHLGQVLFTGRDFLIIDFEGEPARSLSERRAPRTPLRDVAGILRSFDYAVHASLRDQVARGVVEEGSPAESALAVWSQRWRDGVSAAFLGAYLRHVEGAPWSASDREEIAVLLDTCLLEKALYELGYELNNRPSWVGMTLSGLLDLLERPPG